MPWQIRSAAAFSFLFIFLTWVFLTTTRPEMAETSALIGAGTLVGTVIAYVRWKRRAKYDLRALRDLHESGGPPPNDDELPEVPEDAGVLCPCCGNVYAAWLLVCPNCKR